MALSNKSLQATSKLAKALSRNEMNVLSLVHSSLDVSQPLYDFSMWLNSPEFINAKQQKEATQEQSALTLNSPLAFENYNRFNGMGFGIKTLDEIEKGAVIIKQKTSMGLVSNSLFDQDDGPQQQQKKDQEQDKTLDELNTSIEHITKKVSKAIFPGSPALSNKLYQHLMLTQKLIMYDRIQDQTTTYAQYMKAYMNSLPKNDLTTLIFWSKTVLNEIDSEFLKTQIKDTLGYYQMLYDKLMKDPESPYKDKASIGVDEFLWYFSIVSSRHLVMNNEQINDDPNQLLLINPLLDYINHSFDPNVIALPFNDTVNNESYIILQAIKDIKKDDQLLISYGKLPNTHLIQKYGFTLEDNTHNQILAQFPYHDYQNLLFEEQKIKQQIQERLNLKINTQKFQALLFEKRFSMDLMKQLRLSFLTSKNLMDMGTQRFVEVEDFKAPIEQSNEQICYDFLTNNLEKNLGRLKDYSYYEQKIDELQNNMDSVEKYNLMNMYRLHQDEHVILKSNLDQLTKMRDNYYRSV